MHPRLDILAFLAALLTSGAALAEYNAPDLNRRPPAEPRYGIAAMVGGSAPSVAKSLRKAVETSDLTPGSLKSSVSKIVEETSGKDRVAQPNTEVVNGDFTTFNSVGARPPGADEPTGVRQKQREVALESLQTQKTLEDELLKVRQMLAETAPETEQVADVAPVPLVAPAPAVVEEPPPDGSPAGRLLGSLQGGLASRTQMANRLAMSRDSIARKDGRFANLSNSSGGVSFQASLEFNHSIRGSTRSLVARNDGRYGFRKRWESEAETAPLSGEGPVTRKMLGFSGPVEGDRKPLFPIDGPGSSLVAHKPRYTDSSIADAKGGPGGLPGLSGLGGGGAAGGSPRGAGVGRHRGNYGDKAIASAYDGAGGAP